LRAKQNSPGVDFTNVFRPRFLRRFSNQCVFSSYVLLCARKTGAKNVGEIDPCSQISAKKFAVLSQQCFVTLKTAGADFCQICAPFANDVRQKNFCFCSNKQMLMKLTQGVNFTNILHAALLYKGVLRSFSLLTV